MEAELADGTILEFPDGTDPTVIQATVKKMLASSTEQSKVTPAQQVVAPTTAPPERTFGQESVRQIGLTGRHIAEGVGSFPQMLGAPLEALGFKGAGGNVGQLFADYIGLPKPQNAMERVVGAGSRAMASGAPLMKAGSLIEAAKFVPQMAKTVGGGMASQPVAQTIMAGTSGTASEMAKEGGLGEGAQFAAGLAAPLVAAPLIGTAQSAGRLAKGITAPIFSKDAAERGAAKLALRAVGSRGEQVATALSKADSYQTAGQVAAAIDNADLAALQSIANKTDAPMADLIKRGIENRIATSRTALESRLSPVRDEALNLAKDGGVDIRNVVNRIDTFRNASGNASDDVLQNATGEIRRKLLKLVEDTPNPDPNEIYTIRKQLSSTIGKFSKESADWDKKKAAKVERVIQLALDDAIDAAIGRVDPSRSKMWSSDYMGEYAKGSSAIRNVEDRLVKEVDLASKGMSSVRERVTGAENPIQGVNLLSRIATITNTLIRATEGAAGAKVEKALTRMMAPSELGGDKAKLGRLMSQVGNKPESFMQSMRSKTPATRAELGYGVDQMGVEYIPNKPQRGLVPYVSPTEVVDNVPNFTFGKPGQPAPKVTAVGEDLSTPRIGMSREPVGGQMGALRAEDARVLAAQRKAAAAQDAAEAAKQSASRQPTGRGVQFDLDPVTGKLVPTSQGVKGATPEIWQANTGANLKSASEKAAAGRGFDMTAAEKVAWNKTSVDLKTVSPEFSKLTDKQILAKMQDREWVQDALNKAQQKAAMYDVLERQSQDRLAQSLARINREKMLDVVEQLQDTLGSRPSSRGYGQGPKTRAFQRGLLTGAE